MKTHIKPLLSMLSDLSPIKSSSNLGIPFRLLTVNTKANNSFSFSAKNLFSLSISFTSWSSINLIDLQAGFLPLMCLKKFLLLVFMPLASYSSKLFLSAIIMGLHLTCQSVLGFFFFFLSSFGQDFKGCPLMLMTFFSLIIPFANFSCNLLIKLWSFSSRGKTLAL